MENKIKTIKKKAVKKSASKKKPKTKKKTSSLYDAFDTCPEARDPFDGRVYMGEGMYIHPDGTIDHDD